MATQVARWSWRLKLSISVTDAARDLEAQRVLVRFRKDYSARTIEGVSRKIGRTLPVSLEEFYRQNIKSVGEFNAVDIDSATDLLHAHAIPIFSDGCGSLYGVDLLNIDENPSVYFFDHIDEYEKPHWAAGSSIGTFLHFLANHDRAIQEQWPENWQLSIDPDIERCPRAPPSWESNYFGLGGSGG